MKTIQLIKDLATGGFLVIGVTLAGMTSAQAAQSTAATASVDSTYSEHAPEAPDAPDASSPDVVIRGGYNVGRVPVQQVPGCTGPASFCNMYFGS